jgi:transposase
MFDVVDNTPGQQKVERGFRFLKDSWFTEIVNVVVASTVKSDSGLCSE